METSLLIECFNYNSNGRHDLIGKAEKSIADIEKLHCAREGVQLYLPNNVGNNHQDKVLKSQLYVDKISESVQPTFLDYMAGGWELNFMLQMAIHGFRILCITSILLEDIMHTRNSQLLIAESAHAAGDLDV